MVTNARTKKIVGFSATKPGAHVTFNFGGKSGIIDVHKTSETVLGDRQTLYAIRSEDLPLLLTEIAAQFPLERFLSLVRPLRVGWLHHHHIGFITGMFRHTDDGESDVLITEDDLRS